MDQYTEKKATAKKDNVHHHPTLLCAEDLPNYIRMRQREHTDTDASARYIDKTKNSGYPPVTEQKTARSRFGNRILALVSNLPMVLDVMSYVKALTY